MSFPLASLYKDTLSVPINSNHNVLNQRYLITCYHFLVIVYIIIHLPVDANKSEFYPQNTKSCSHLTTRFTILYIFHSHSQKFLTCYLYFYSISITFRLIHHDASISNSLITVESFLFIPRHHIIIGNHFHSCLPANGIFGFGHYPCICANRTSLPNV